MPGNFDGKIFAKIHHDYNRYITIEIFCDLICCDFEHSQNFANTFQFTRWTAFVCMIVSGCRSDDLDRVIVEIASLYP